MRGGKLRRQVTIQQPAIGQNGVGEATQTWSTLAANVWAEITPLKGKETIQAGQVNAQADTMIRIRYLAGVAPAMRVLYGTRNFEIQNVANLEERNREMELLCTERQ